MVAEPEADADPALLAVHSRTYHPATGYSGRVSTTGPYGLVPPGPGYIGNTPLAHRVLGKRDADSDAAILYTSHFGLPNPYAGWTARFHGLYGHPHPSNTIYSPYGVRQWW